MSISVYADSLRPDGNPYTYQYCQRRELEWTGVWSATIHLQITAETQIRNNQWNKMWKRVWQIQNISLKLWTLMFSSTIHIKHSHEQRIYVGATKIMIKEFMPDPRTLMPIPHILTPFFYKTLKNKLFCDFIYTLTVNIVKKCPHRFFRDLL